MKRRVLQLMAVVATAGLVLSGCGTTQTSTTTDTSEAEVSAEEEIAAEAEEVEEEVEEIVSVAEIVYQNIYFDYSEEIAAQQAEIALVPEAAQINLTVADENGATGVMLVESAEEGNTTDYYLNAMVAGNTLTFTATEGAIASATSSVAGDLEVTDAGVSVVPATIMAEDPEDEIITITMEDGTVYTVHTVNDVICGMSITGEGVADANAGVYTFSVDKFLIRVNTSGELIYYRNVECCENMVENFSAQVTDEGMYFAYLAELDANFRNVNGGYSSGMYIVMDSNYVEIDYVTLAANEDENHTLWQGYLYQHEFIILGADHYIVLSYTPVLVSNLPDSVEGIDGSSQAYVWACIFQEIKDGVAVQEINTTDYALLYESAVQCIDYANSTDDGTVVTVNSVDYDSWADGYMDYCHANSIDYTLNAAGEVDKILVSMKCQCAVYQFDFQTGAMEWILGGKTSTFSGYEEYTSTRSDDNGVEFSALTFGQHYARYINKNADGTLSEDPIISIFDNQTGTAPFLTVLDPATLTRTMKVALDTAAGTAEVSDVINGTDLNEMNDKYHIASHCGTVEYQDDTAVVIGWGMHAVIDALGVYVPEGTMSDAGYDDLRQGSRPIFTEYDMTTDTITMELTVSRNSNSEESGELFSYRVYKTQN